AILNDLLDLSKIEAGKLDLERTVFGLRRLLEEALRPFAVQARAKGLSLAFQVEPAVPDELVGDPNRLRQILINLVGNAVKFTERGGITVLVEEVLQGFQGHQGLHPSLLTAAPLGLMPSVPEGRQSIAKGVSPGTPQNPGTPVTLRFTVRD